MIRLHPLPESPYYCPFDDSKLEVIDWYIPGMRNLADLRCPKCDREFYGDLPAGHGLYFPMLLDKKSGDVHDPQNIQWFSNWLRNSYANRSDEPLEFVVEEFRPLRAPLLLNCLDTLYGHCLLKLLNSQYYIDKRPDLDLIVLVPKCLRWMVPEDVATIWSIDLPLIKGIEWNDWLAQEIRRRIEPYEGCWLSVAFSHPHPNDFTIERFTGIKPFPLLEWVERLKRPTITFIWRDDRYWWDEKRYTSLTGLPRRIKRRLLRIKYSQIQIIEQTRNIITLASELKKVVPNLDFAIAGLGFPGNMPDWIHDMRTIEIDAQIEKDWCNRYSKSQVVIGVHGSNMLLPSAHSGSVVELVPIERLENLVQDILLINGDIREIMFRYRFVPIESSINTISKITISLLKNFSDIILNFTYPFSNHEKIQSDPWLIVNHRLNYNKSVFSTSREEED